MYKVKVNEQYNFSIIAEQGKVVVNGEELSIDRSIINDEETHVIYQNRSYSLEVVNLNREDKLATIKVNGSTYQISIEDQFDQLLKQLGMDNMAASKVMQIKAPMPGLVLKVLVSEGEEVRKGDSLLVLEAMKMENMIKSPSDGVIKKITVKMGDKVEKNEVLINF